MKQIIWTIGLVATLGTAVPAMAQDQPYHGERQEHSRRTPQILQGTVQSVNGSMLVLSVPGPQVQGATQNPYAYPTGQVFQVDISDAVFEGPDGSQAGQQQVYPGERVIVAVRSTGTNQYAPQQGYGNYQQGYNAPPYQNPNYAPPYNSPQYNGGQVPPQQYAPPLKATLVEPLMF